MMAVKEEALQGGDRMGFTDPNRPEGGRVEEVKGNESSTNEGGVSGNDWRRTARAGRHD